MDKPSQWTRKGVLSATEADMALHRAIEFVRQQAQQHGAFSFYVEVNLVEMCRTDKREGTVQ